MEVGFNWFVSYSLVFMFGIKHYSLRICGNQFIVFDCFEGMYSSSWLDIIQKPQLNLNDIHLEFATDNKKLLLLALLFSGTQGLS